MIAYNQTGGMINEYIKYVFRCSSSIFSVGKIADSGTCEFATDECLIKCAAISNGTNENKIPFKTKEKIFHYFRDKPTLKICNKIIKELQKCDHPILYWFASGDCPSTMTEKIASIIDLLDENGIRQCGFTRNEELMKLISNNNCNIVLTVENEGQITRLREYVRLFGVPNYESGDVDIYKIEEETSAPSVSYSCGQSFGCSSSTDFNSSLTLRTRNVHRGHTTFTNKLIEKHHNCRKCFDDHKGCFSR